MARWGQRIRGERMTTGPGVGWLGTGKMGSAMLDGWLARGLRQR